MKTACTLTAALIDQSLSWKCYHITKPYLQVMLKLMIHKQEENVFLCSRGLSFFSHLFYFIIPSQYCLRQVFYFFLHQSICGRALFFLKQVFPLFLQLLHPCFPDLISPGQLLSETFLQSVAFCLSVFVPVKRLRWAISDLLLRGLLHLSDSLLKSLEMLVVGWRRPSLLLFS